jgi:hypothetical protein
MISLRLTRTWLGAIVAMIRRVKTVVPLVLVSVAVGVIAVPDARANDAPPNSMNSYVLRAVAQLAAGYSGLGYGPHAYSHNLTYGSGIVRADHPPETMCVAASAEVIVTALQLYMLDHPSDHTPETYLPVDGWERMRPVDIRSYIWVSPQLHSSGTADAFVIFGIGRRQNFAELAPGSFINLNRQRTGHSVTFLGFIDKHGNTLSSYSSQVAGFKYFSSQGSDHTNGAGFGYRYAFFEKAGCPTLPDGMRRDCGIRFSAVSNSILNTGYLLLPHYWSESRKNANLAQEEKLLFNTGALANALVLRNIPLPSVSAFSDFHQIIGAVDTMILNPKYVDEDIDQHQGR